MRSEKLTVSNDLGLHVRAARLLMKTARRYGARIEIEVDGERYDAKSLIGLLAAGVEKDMEIEILCSGEDEEEACRALKDVVLHELKDV